MEDPFPIGSCIWQPMCLGTNTGLFTQFHHCHRSCPALRSGSRPMPPTRWGAFAAESPIPRPQLPGKRRCPVRQHTRSPHSSHGASLRSSHGASQVPPAGQLKAPSWRLCPTPTREHPPVDFQDIHYLKPSRLFPVYSDSTSDLQTDIQGMRDSMRLATLLSLQHPNPVPGCQ